MTAKNMKKSSITGDRYYTPDWCVKQCFQHVIPALFGEHEPLNILEPSAGAGVFVRFAQDWFPSSIICANDIDKEVGPWPQAHLSIHKDFLKVRPERICTFSTTDCFDLSIGNPPFTYALEFVQQSLAVAEHVIFIVRQGFLSSAKRSGFFRKTKPAIVRIIPHRPSFTVDGQTDTADYCWVGWRRGYTGSTDLDWLPEVPKAERKPPRQWEIVA